MAEIVLETDTSVPSGTSLEVLVEEDIDGDGVVENYASASLSGGTESVTLAGFDASSGNQFRVRQLKTSDLTASAETFSVSVSGSSTVPSAPSNLSVDDATVEDELTIGWTDNSSNEDGFYVYRAQSSGSVVSDYAQVADLAANTTSYTDTGLSDGTEYFYRVSAYNADGESELSNEASAVTVLPAPSGTSLDTSVEDEISTTWADNADSESGYRVFRGTTSGSLSQVADLSADTTSYVDTGLNDGEKYFYQVEAYTSDATSRGSEVSGVTVLPAPTGLSVDSVSASSADVSWTVNHDYGSQRVEYRRSSDSTWTAADSGISLSTSSYTLSGLLNGEKYDVRVVAVTEHTETVDQ